MGKWTHSICSRCWNIMFPDKPNPVKLKEEFALELECCACGEKHNSGIFYRESPNSKLLICKGEHNGNLH